MMTTQSRQPVTDNPIQTDRITQNVSATSPSICKILVALDYHPVTENEFPEVLAQGIHLGKLTQSRAQSQLLLFHCIPELSPAMSELAMVNFATYGSTYNQAILAEEEQAHQALIAEREAWLTHCRQQVESAGLATDVLHQFGEIGPAICQLARQWHADLIVVGRRGRSGLSEMLLGSVSNYVVHHAPCNVFIVQNMTAATE